MNISFKTHFPWPGPDGNPEPTNFPQQIIEELVLRDGAERRSRRYKLHTIRRVKAKPRHREGMKLVLQTGSRFKPRPFVETECTGTQMLHMECQPVRDTLALNVRLILPGTVPHLLRGDKLEQLATNDGFASLEQFTRWFTLDVLLHGPGYYQLVHWSDVRY
jgi:hypothetical protein